ncbi:MAG: ATP-dependent Clp protease proteolytic subunit [Actinobacteria bacterium]|nr:ATP-dependent Clp protease proteolytic subunit [Actinomycetota bacterium]
MLDPPIPEIPHPGGPERPASEPTLPVAPAPSIDDPRTQLRAQRRLLLTGRIDDATATRICAELMLLDGQEDAPVELLINSTGGPVATAASIIDVVTLMRAPVATRCLGIAAGMAAVVLAHGTGGRSAATRSAISLRIDEHHAIDGRADDIQRQSAQITAAWQHVAEQLAAVSALSAHEAASALRDGGPLTADEALAARLIDEIVGR